MTHRLVGAIWGLIVLATLALLPLAVRDRLPEPLATHWGNGPDRSTAFTSHLVISVLLWLLPWAVMMGFALHGRMAERRMSRAYWWGFLFGVGVLVVGVELSILHANLDRPSWTGAELPVWSMPVVLGASLVAGVLAGYLGRGAADQPSPAGEEVPRLRLRPGQRSVWISRLVNHWLVAVAVASSIVVLASAVMSMRMGAPAGIVGVLILATAIALFASLFTSITARITDNGLAIAFGPFGWPVRRIKLSKIERAWSETRRPSQVGGWGLRGVPGSATIMLRGGECLVIRYRSGGQLVISIDDARRGAALLNALIEGGRSDDQPVHTSLHPDR
ncbi:hypothetical protein [Streptosporangium sp. KLBMP 9127]|nr:hypothetical protein [Streptosporangium sp. KLBMP 9127]